MLLRGQGATELIVLLALIAVVGLIIYASSQQRLSESNTALIMSQARASVNDLASAASEVYSEGPGARRKVLITIPEGANPARVYVNNTMINIGLNLSPGVSTDINTQTTMRVVQGADFPTTPGSYWVYVTAQQGYVLIGSSNLNINPRSLSIVMSPYNSTNATIIFSDIGTIPLSVNLTPQWSYNSTVSITLNATNFTLSPSSSAYISLTAQTFANTPLQTYVGSILVSTNTTETETVSLSVSVVGTQTLMGVSYITVDTFRNSSYLTATTNFPLPKMVNITGSGLIVNTVTTLNILNSAGISVISSNITNCSAPFNTDSSGGFLCQVNPAGLTPGSYTATANQSAVTVSASFSITACS